MATQGLKALYGKPRPDMLARCDPDLSNIAAHAVSGLGRRLSGAPTMVTWEICQNKSDTLKVDGFSSFPSGHASCRWLPNSNIQPLTSLSFVRRIDLFIPLAVFQVLNRLSISPPLSIRICSSWPEIRNIGRGVEWQCGFKERQGHVYSTSRSRPASLYGDYGIRPIRSCSFYSCFPLVRLSTPRV